MTLEIEGNKLESLFSLYYLKNSSYDFYGRFLYSGNLGWGNIQFWKNIMQMFSVVLGHKPFVPPPGP